MAAVDDIIRKWVERAEQSGELKSSAWWGKPLNLDDGFDETPAELRMAFKVLRNAGYRPAEVGLLNSIDTLRRELAAATGGDAAAAIRRRLHDALFRIALVREQVRRRC